MIVIDKDFTELPALQQEFPQATVLFLSISCHQVLFLADCVDLEVAKENRDMARETIRMIVNADSEESYTALKNDLFDKTNTTFKEYFIKNWDVCKEKWVTFLRDNHLHFANTTNNRLECHNHKLKDVVSRSMLLSEMFEKMLLFCKTNAEGYTHKVFTEEFSACSTANDSIANVLIINATRTAYSAERIVEQLKLSRSVTYAVSNGDNDGVFIAVYKISSITYC